MRQVIRRGADSEEDYTSMSRQQSCVMNVPDIRDGTCKPFSDVKVLLPMYPRGAKYDAT